MSAINGVGRLVFKLLEKRINTQEVIAFLKQMLAFHPKRHLVVVMDQAKPHTSKQMKSFIDQTPRLHVFYLPPYSPDWNPDEKVWNHLKTQELKSHTAKSQAELKSLTRKKLRTMANNPSLLRGIYFRCHVASFFG
jgi:transposase